MMCILKNLLSIILQQLTQSKGVSKKTMMLQKVMITKIL